MATLLEKIKSKTIQLHDETIMRRRHLHANPELSFQEKLTAAYVFNELKEFGLEPVSMAGTGVVAIIRGKKDSGRVVALRADMDALPIQEKSDKPYRSKNQGVMHACGHDVHTASLLTTARILNELQDEFGGFIKLIFQPGEEKNPGGASIMIDEGVLNNPTPDVVIAQHVMPIMDTGKIGFRKGKYMASSDEIRLTVIGKGGHASTPDLNIDPVLIASHIIIALQQVVSRMANPKQPSVLSFGRFIAEGATNVVPGEVHLAGTFRALDETWRKKGLEQIKTIATGVAESMGGKCEVQISHGYPFLLNDMELTDRIRRYAEEYVGNSNVEEIDMTMGSEDFAYYSHQVPSCLYRLGTRNIEKGITSYVHTPGFDVDEDALTFGPGLMAWIAIRELNHQKDQ